MAFTILSRDVAQDPAIQSVWYDTDLATLAAGAAGEGVVSGCAVTAQGSPDMTVAVAAGIVRIASGVFVPVTSGNVTIGAASGTNPRVDLVSVSNAGVKTVTAGTAAASPKPPALPAGHIALAFVLVPTSDTTIGAGQITDKRVILPTPAAGSVVRRVKATSTADDTTTAATMQDSSLSLVYTPIYADAELEVRVDGECSALRTGGTIVERYMWVGILNSTDAVELVRQVRGSQLGAASALAAQQFLAIGLRGTYVVNSLAARTFKLQYMSGVVTNVQAALNGSRTGGIVMTITELRP